MARPAAMTGGGMAPVPMRMAPSTVPGQRMRYVRARKDPMEWPSRKYGAPGNSSPIRRRRAYTSSATQFQLPRGPKYSRAAPGARDWPWPMWSFPATAKPRSVSHQAKGS